MQKLINLINSNFDLTDKEVKLIYDLCVQITEDKSEKIFFVESEIIRYKLDFESVIAYLFYELKIQPYDCNNNISEIYNALLFEIIGSNFSSEDQSEMLRNMFIAMSKDVRVIIIKLCKILYEIKSYKLPISEEQKTNLQSINDIFAPLAERLGFIKIKHEIEDNCLRLLNPTIYQGLKNNALLQREKSQNQIELTLKRLNTIVDELKIKDATIMARQKHISSIYRKMLEKHYTLANIYDIMAMRVITNTIEECYAVLGKVHSIYKPLEGRFKDYIASPKSNGYQSIHTTVIVENQMPLEIQIRTVEMHKSNEFGVFAHWLYKEKRNKINDMDKRIIWLREITENSKNLSSSEFVETLKVNLCEGQIYVQTPKGKVLELSDGSTILDFAYAIHSDIGNNCIGGKINNIIKPLPTKLKNGDMVEIITSQNSKGPSRDWLKIVKTSQAKDKINAFFKREFKEENIKLGLSLLENALKSKGYVASKLLNDKYFNPQLFKYVFDTKEELLASIGHGSVPVNNIANKIITMFEKDNKVLPKINDSSKLVVKQNKDGILVDGDSGMLVRYAGCCLPVFGEEVIGYISRGRGVTIHRADCHNLKFLESERLIDVVWDNNSTSRSTSANFKITSAKSDSFLNNLTQELLRNGIKIIGLESKQHTYLKIITNIKVEVCTQEDLPKIIKVIKQINSVEDVYRLVK